MRYSILVWIGWIMMVYTSLGWILFDLAFIGSSYWFWRDEYNDENDINKP